MRNNNYDELLETLKSKLSCEGGGISHVYSVNHPLFPYILKLIKEDYYLVKKKKADITKQ